MAAIAKAVEAGRVLSSAELASQTNMMNRWRSSKIEVVAAQKKLYTDVALWSNLPPTTSFNDVILPALRSGKLVAPGEPCFDLIVVAAYRVCEAAAKHKGVDLATHTPPEILQMISGEAGDIYK